LWGAGDGRRQRRDQRAGMEGGGLDTVVLCEQLWEVRVDKKQKGY
jgi:hypothetical protein